MPAGAPGAGSRGRDVNRDTRDAKDKDRDPSRDGRDMAAEEDAKNIALKKNKNEILDPEAAGADAGITFAGETEEEAEARRKAGEKSNRPEEVRVQQGGLQGGARTGVETESNGRRTRAGLAI